MRPFSTALARPTALAALALPLTAVPLLLAATAESTAVLPRTWVALATVGMLAVVTAVGGKRPRPGLDLPVAAALGLAASHLLFAPGLPRGHDTFNHLWGVWAVAREAGAGDWIPLWLHGLGFGMPLLQFYGMVPFLVALPFSLAGLAPAAALKGAFLVFGAVAATGMYTAVVRWTGDRRAGLVAAAAYAFAPYRLLDVHYRMAFGESAGLAVLPFVFLFGTAAVRDGGRRRLAAAASVAALMIVTHPLSALLAAFGLGVWSVAEILVERRGVFAQPARLAAMWVAGAALAGFFVVPFFSDVRHLDLGPLVRGEERDYFSLYGVEPGQLVERRLWNGLLPTAPVGAPQDATDEEMPYYFGLVLLALVPLGSGLGRLPGEAAPPLRPSGLPALTLASLALATGPVAGFFARAFPPLAALQFPWRFLGLAAFGAAALAGLATARLLAAWPEPRRTALLPGLVAALLILDAFPYTGAAEWLPAYRGLSYPRSVRPGTWVMEEIDPPYPLRTAGLVLPPADPRIDSSGFCCPYPELRTPTARALSEPPRSPEVLARAGVGLFVRPIQQRLVRLQAAPYAVFQRPGRAEALPFTRAGGEITVQVDSSDGRGGTVIVLEEHFPGWETLTKEGWREVEPTRSGLLRARVAAGEKEVRFRFRRWTRERLAGWLLSGSTALTLLALCAGRPRPRAAPPPGRG